MQIPFHKSVHNHVCVHEIYTSPFGKFTKSFCLVYDRSFTFSAFLLLRKSFNLVKFIHFYFVIYSGRGERERGRKKREGKEKEIIKNLTHAAVEVC